MSKFFITINRSKYQVQAGQTILDVCLAQHIFIPTLCKHPDLTVQGKCRVCLVEVVGQGLVTACSTPVTPKMEIKTNTLNVRRARGVNLEMIYAEHIEKCASCIHDHSCLLKKYATQYNLKITRYVDRKKEHPLWHFGKKPATWLEQRIKYIQSNYPLADQSLRIRQAQLHADGYIEFDASKCIDCGICTEVCTHKQTCDFYQTTGKGPATLTQPSHNLSRDCAYCGQCVVHCPVGAIQGVPHWQQVEELLEHKDSHHKILVAQIAPSVRVSIGEEFGLKYGQVVTGQLATSMRVLGFDAAFDVTVGADFTTYEEARELIHWLESDKPRPMFTSCCPGWVKFVEFYYPEFVSHLTTTRSPHLHSAILAKTYWAEALGKSPADIIVVSIMPCTAKKQEISLDRHLFSFKDSTGKKIKLPIVDYVLTTREYAYLLRRHKVDLGQLSSQPMDNPLGNSSGAGVIYGASGGVMESALRTADYFLRLKKEKGTLDGLTRGELYELNKYKFSKISHSRIEFKSVRGQQGLKEARVNVGGHKLKVAVINGLGNARQLLENLKVKRSNYDYVEVMACPGGCIGGGGQPVPVDSKIRTKRAAALYTIDRHLSIRAAHQNQALLGVYRSFFRGDEDKLEALMHCRYLPLEKRGGVKKVN